MKIKEKLYYDAEKENGRKKHYGNLDEYITSNILNNPIQTVDNHSHMKDSNSC